MQSDYIEMDSLKINALPFPVVISDTGEKLAPEARRTVAKGLAGVTAFSDLVKKYKLSFSSVKRLKDLFLLAKVSIIDGKMKKFVNDIFTQSASPVFRNAMRKLFGDMIVQETTERKEPEMPKKEEVITETTEAVYAIKAQKFGEFASRNAEKIQWGSFIIFAIILFANFYFRDPTGVFFYVVQYHIISILVLSLIIIVFSVVRKKDNAKSLNSLPGLQLKKSLFEHIKDSPLLWFLVTSIMLFINTYLHEGVSMENLNHGTITPDIWNSYFGGLGFENLPINIKIFIQGRVNDILATPFVVYGFLSVLKLYSKKLYEYLNKSLFKPLLIMSAGFGFMMTEFGQGRHQITPGVYTFSISDISDYYAYIVVTAVMLFQFIAWRLYDYFKKIKALSLVDALESLSGIKNKKIHFLGFLAGFIPFILFMYFAYTVPFFNRFGAFYDNIYYIAALLIGLPIVSLIKEKTVQYFENKIRVPRARREIISNSFASRFYLWASISVVLFSGFSLMLRYFWKLPIIFSLSSHIAIFIFSYAAIVLVWYFQNIIKTGKSIREYNRSIFKQVNLSIFSYSGLVALVVFIYKTLFEDGGVLRGALGNVIPSAAFVPDIVFLIMMGIFFVMMLLYILGSSILNNYETGKKAKLALDAAKGRPGQGGMPVDVAVSLVNYLGRNCIYDTEQQGGKKPDVCIVQEGQDISGWSFEMGDNIYTARFESGAIIVMFRDKISEIQGTIEVYALRQEDGEGFIKEMWMTEKLYKSIQSDRDNALRQIYLHETAEMLFQKYIFDISNFTGIGKVNWKILYRYFMDEFAERIKLEWGMGPNYVDFIKSNLRYERIGNYFGKAVFDISANDMAELVERLDTYLVGSVGVKKKPYLGKDLRKIDQIVLNSDLDWAIFYSFLISKFEEFRQLKAQGAAGLEAYEEIDLIESYKVRQEFEKHNNIYIEDIMERCVLSKDAGREERVRKIIELIEFLRERNILERISISKPAVVQKSVLSKTTKTRYGQEALPLSAGLSLIEWINTNCEVKTGEEMFQIISDRSELNEWNFEEGNFAYTAFIEKGEIKVRVKNKMTDRENILGVQALRGGDGEIWLLENTYNSIISDDDAKRQIILHEFTEDTFQKIWEGEVSNEEKYAQFISVLTESMPQYKDVLEHLANYNNMLKYFGRELNIGDADRIAELMEKIDTAVLGSKRGQDVEIKDLNDLDKRIVVSDLDWRLFYNSLANVLSEEQRIPEFGELRRIFEEKGRIDVNVLRDALDDSDVLGRFISVLLRVAAACDSACEAANIEKGGQSADIALEIAYSIFKQQNSEIKFRQLVGEELASKIKDNTVRELIAVLGEQLIRVEEGAGGKRQLVIDQFSYLMVLELEKELGVEPFKLLDVLLRTRICASVIKLYDLEEVLGQRRIIEIMECVIKGEAISMDVNLRKKKVGEGDPFSAFLLEIKEQPGYMVTVGDLINELATCRITKDIPAGYLSEFNIRLFAGASLDVYRKTQVVLNNAIEMGINVVQEGGVFCGISPDGITDELGDTCAEFRNDMARSLANNYSLRFQKGDFVRRLKAMVGSCLAGFSNASVLDNVRKIFKETDSPSVDLCIIDFEACFEIEKVEGHIVRIKPRNADIAEILRKLSSIRQVCFVGLDKELIEQNGDKIKAILANTYGLGKLSNIYLEKVFTIDEIVDSGKELFGLNNFNTTVMVSAQKNQGKIKNMADTKAIPFKAVVNGEEAPLSSALGIAVLANSLTESNAEEILRRYFQVVGIEIEENQFKELIEEIINSGFMLIVMPEPKPIIRELMRTLACSVVIDLSA
jgi:hypothetical protein